MVSDTFLSSFIFTFKVRLVECFLHFLSYHVFFSSSFPVLSRFIFSLSFLLLHNCHRFMFVRHVLFYTMSCTVCLILQFSFYRRVPSRHFVLYFTVHCMFISYATFSYLALLCAWFLILYTSFWHLLPCETICRYIFSPTYCIPPFITCFLYSLFL